MAAITQGLSGLTFGVSAWSGAVVQAYTLSSSAQVQAEVFGESGASVCRRYDDVTTEISVDVVHQGMTLPTPGDAFTYNSVAYECTGVEKKYSNKEFLVVTIKGKRSSAITPS